MKFLKQLIYSSMLIVGLSLTASAQKDDQKKPPKENPPVVTPKDKPRDNRPPRGNGDDKGKGGGKKAKSEL